MKSGWAAWHSCERACLLPSSIPPPPPPPCLKADGYFFQAGIEPIIYYNKNWHSMPCVQLAFYFPSPNVSQVQSPIQHKPGAFLTQEKGSVQSSLHSPPEEQIQSISFLHINFLRSYETSSSIHHLTFRNQQWSVRIPFLGDQLW